MAMSRLRITDFSDSDSDGGIVRYSANNSIYNPAMTAQLLEHHPLTMPLSNHFIHVISRDHEIYSLDFNVANNLFNTIGQQFLQIYKAGNPDADPVLMTKPSIATHLPPLPSHLFDVLPYPAILDVYPSYSQNPLMAANTIEGIQQMYRVAQKVGLDAAEWTWRARLVCAQEEGRYGWSWDDIEREEELAVLGPAGCNALIEAPASVESDNSVRDVILHPRFSNWIALHPEYNPHDALLALNPFLTRACDACSPTPDHWNFECKPTARNNSPASFESTDGSMEGSDSGSSDSESIGDSSSDSMAEV